MDIPADSYNHRFAGANCYCQVGVDLFSVDAHSTGSPFDSFPPLFRMDPRFLGSQVDP